MKLLICVVGGEKEQQHYNVNVHFLRFCLNELHTTTICDHFEFYGGATERTNQPTNDRSNAVCLRLYSLRYSIFRPRDIIRKECGFFHVRKWTLHTHTYLLTQSVSQCIPNYIGSKCSFRYILYRQNGLLTLTRGRAYCWFYIRLFRTTNAISIAR